MEQRIRDEFRSPFSDPALLVVTGLAHPADSDAGRAAMRDILAPLLASHAVVGAVSPGSSLDTLLVGVGANNTTALAIVGLSPLPGAMDSVRAITTAHVADFRRAHPSLTLRWTGQPALVSDLRTMGAREARRAELRALPVSIVVALIAFGTLIDAGVALAAAALAIATALGVMGALSGFVPASSFTRTLVPLVGLALTVDYVLFLTRRARTGADPRELRRTIGLAAGIVALGFSGLTIAPTGELRSAAFAGIVTCAAAALAAITLTPLPAAVAAAPQPGARWLRWGWFVTRRPWVVLTISALPLAFLANAARTAVLTTPLDQLLPAGMESADAFRDLQQAARAGAAGSLRVLLDLPRSTPVLSVAGWDALGAATRALRAVPGAADARSLATFGTRDLGVARNVLPQLLRDTYVSRTGNTALIDVIPDVAGSEARSGGRAVALVQAVRASDATQATGIAGARFSVAGLPAYALDYQTSLGRALPWIVVGTSVATLLAFARGISRASGGVQSGRAQPPGGRGGDRRDSVGVSGWLRGSAHRTARAREHLSHRAGVGLRRRVRDEHGLRALSARRRA